MSEFAFHPPDLSPSASFAQRGDYGQQQRPGSSSAYPPSNYQPTIAGGVGGSGPLEHDSEGFSRSPAPFEHLSSGGASSRPGTAGEDAQRGGGTASGHQSRGISPGPPGAVQQQHPPPFGGYSFNSQHPGQPGANIRNTRPMTAPSSVSAPYFHGAMYSPHSSHVPPSYYPGGHNFDSYQQPQPSPFQYQVDSGVASLGHDSDSQRERGFSLPELVGIAPGVAGVDGGLPDDPRYSSGGSEGRGSPSSGPFLYAPPPRPFYDPSQPPQTILHDPFGGPHSRPTTADSSRPTSSHQLRPHPGHAPPIPHGPTSAYVSRAVKSELHRDGAPAQQPGESKVYNFVASAGQTAKRPRRRYDEIERLYTCDYPGCQKAYGTLNHLNSHKTMQKHGPKSTPAQFKELRKAWRENKKRQAAEAARAAAAEASQNDALPLPANMHSVDRPRPSTSAGEYHYAVPAPFMTPLGAPVPLYAPQMHLPPPPTAGFIDPNGNAGPSGVPSGVYSSTFGVVNPLGPPLMAAPGQQSIFGSQPSYQASSVRPVTAPNYYGAPAFGMGGLGGASGPPLRQLAPTYGNGMAPQARRMSLPSELKQPTPIFGYGPPQGEEGFGSIEEESGEHGLGALGSASQEQEVSGGEER